jgi:alkyl hydroperoxide reductase subunit AhpC
VGIGQPKHAERVCGRKAPSILCLTHKNTKIHRQYGLTEATIGQAFSPKLYTSAVRAMVRGNMQGESTGNTRMMPGTFIVDRDGVIQYTYYSQHMGDHPNINELIRVGKDV